VKFKITCRYGEQPAEPAAPEAKKKKDAPAA
jgi:hypothetical protein